MRQFLRKIFGKADSGKTVQIKIELDNGDVYEETTKLQDLMKELVFSKNIFINQSL